MYLKIEPKGFADSLGMRCERKRAKDETKSFGLSK